MIELFINNILVDLSDDIQHSLNYAIADIREPNKRDTSFSKTITLVGSKETNKLFAHLFEVNVTVNSSGTTNFSPSFNPNLKAPAIMYCENISVFSGFVQLKGINVLDKYDVEYEIVMYGKLGDLFFDLGENELTELDLSEYDHTYSYANIVASWSGTLGNGYLYPMIDRGLNDTINWKVQHWQPAVFLKTYIDKIFKYGKYNYESDFLNSDFFKRLYMPFVGEGLKLTEAEAISRRFEANTATTINNVNNIQGIGVWSTYVFETETFDGGNNYNTGTYKWTCPANGTYNFSAELLISVRMNPSSPAYFRSANSAFNNILTGWAEIVKEEPSGTIVTISPPLQLMIGVQVPTGLITGDTTYAVATRQLTTISGGYYIGVGDKVYVRYWVRKYNQGTFTFTNFSDGASTPIAGDVYIVTNAGSKFENSVVNNGYAEGETILMNSAIPTKVKMRDILSSTLKMFNLYAEEDTSEQRKLIITPRNDFYNDEVVNWENKLDYSTPLQIEPMGALDAKRYELTWDYDEDYYNKYYKDKYNKVYGNRTIDVQNDFLSNVVETKVVWAATVPANNNTSDRVVPTILAADGSAKQITAKPRLIYYGGLRNCNTWNFLANGGSTPQTQYPYSGHLDDPFNSTVDLNFGVVSEIMYTAPYIIYTNNNVYNKYHKQFIDEITDVNSKIVTAYFWLTPSDILKLSFRKNYFLDNAYFRLNKIIDYNPDGSSLTKCEFISINTATTYAPFVSSGTVYFGGNMPYEQFEESFPNFKTQPETNNTGVGGVNNNIIRGLGNLVPPSARNIISIGDFNIVGENVDGAMIINSSGNTIAGGVQNVTLINSSGQTVTESNSVYINNVDLITFITNETGVGRYIANLDQVGMNDPVATVLYSTIGTIVWSYYDVGGYLGTLSGAFPDQDKTAIYITSKANDPNPYIMTANWNSANEILIRTYAGTTLMDGIMESVTIEIRVYP